MNTIEPDEEPERREQLPAVVPQSVQYDFTHEDICELLARIKRDIQLVIESKPFKELTLGTFSLADAPTLVDYTWGQIVIKAMKSDKLEWKKEG